MGKEKQRAQLLEKGQIPKFTRATKDPHQERLSLDKLGSSLLLRSAHSRCQDLSPLGSLLGRIGWGRRIWPGPHFREDVAAVAPQPADPCSHLARLHVCGSVLRLRATGTVCSYSNSREVYI